MNWDTEIGDLLDDGSQVTAIKHAVQDDGRWLTTFTITAPPGENMLDGDFEYGPLDIFALALSRNYTP